MDNLTPDQIQQMIAMLQAMLPKTTPSNPDAEKISDDIAEVDHTEKIKTRPSKKISGGFSNKFDEMMEARLHKEDIEIDKMLAVHAPTPRTRRFEPVRVTCRVCGKSETVNPTALSESKDRYKCNTCARSPG